MDNIVNKPPTAMSRQQRAMLCLCVAIVATIASGCRLPMAPEPVVDYFYLNPNKDLSEIGRVAVIELGNDSSYPPISSEMTDALFEAVQKKQVFGVIAIRQTNPVWRSLQLDNEPPYSLEQLVAIRRELKCDGIMVGSVTAYQPYPHMTIGLRAKLVDLADGQLLWAMEQVWDTTDKTTEKRIKNYFQTQMRSGFAPLREELVAVSSLKFVKFVAYEVAQTLRRQ